jgi:hypothetical protein
MRSLRFVVRIRCVQSRSTYATGTSSLVRECLHDSSRSHSTSQIFQNRLETLTELQAYPNSGMARSKVIVMQRVVRGHAARNMFYTSLSVHTYKVTD